MARSGGSSGGSSGSREGNGWGESIDRPQGAAPAPTALPRHPFAPHQGHDGHKQGHGHGAVSPTASVAAAVHASARRAVYDARNGSFARR